MGKILRLNGVTLTDLAAPKIIERDGIESAGSLFLFDGAHSYGGFSGVPAVGGAVPNALANKAAALISASEADTHFQVAGTGPVADVMALERTPQGGIHSILTQAGGQTSEASLRFRVAPAIRAYIYANRHVKNFYFSLWTKVTRMGVLSAGGQSPFHWANNTTNLFFHISGGGNPAPYTAPKRSGAKYFPVIDDHSSLGFPPYSKFVSVGVSGVTGTGPSPSTEIEFGGGSFGAWAGLNYNKTPSRVLYRAYCEDLNTSGRTYAEVEAIDYALYQAAFAPGGKFYGDTYTDPATLP